MAKWNFLYLLVIVLLDYVDIKPKLTLCKGWWEGSVTNQNPEWNGDTLQSLECRVKFSQEYNKNSLTMDYQGTCLLSSRKDKNWYVALFYGEYYLIKWLIILHYINSSH